MKVTRFILSIRDPFISSFTAILMLVFVVTPLIHAASSDNMENTVQAEFHIGLTCPGENKAGSFISLKDDLTPTLVYHGETDSTGLCIISNIQPGQYTIQITRCSYTPYIAQSNLNWNFNLNVILEKIKKAPAYVHVNKLDLKAEWTKAPADSTVFSEDWSSGSFAGNGWTITGGANWIILNNFGNPPPSAVFNWSPSVQNYSQQLTSRLIPASYAPKLSLHYDFYLGNYACTTLQVLAVEIWNETKWDTLWSANTYGGSYPWTAVDLDLSEYSNQDIRIRFDSYGEDSYDIDKWGLDNIRITGSPGTTGSSSCVTNYKVFLNNTQLGTTTDTTFQIPPAIIQYGQTNQFCVKAAYPNGDSPPGCSGFTSNFVYPPTNLAGVYQSSPNDYWAHLTWEKPKKADGSIPPGIYGYKIYRGGEMIHLATSPDSLSFNDLNPVPASYDYRVTAVYNLASYGYPGQAEESLPCAPVSVYIHPGIDAAFPFSEQWTLGGFCGNGWTFEPSSGNWSVDASYGNAPPSAKFSGTPADSNYSYSLVSPYLDISGWSCGTITLDFDYIADPLVGNSAEHLAVEVNNNMQWIPVYSCYNSGSPSWGWSHVHKDISFLQGSSFRVRFRAYGEHSTDIVSWHLDNILLSGSCSPPKNFQLAQNANQIILTWSPPDCTQYGYPAVYSSCDETPEAAYAGVPATSAWYGNEFYTGWNNPKAILQEVDVWFEQNPDHGGDCLSLDVFNQNRELISSSGAFIPPDNGWITVPVNSILVADSFFVMVHWNNVAHETNRLGFDMDANYGWLYYPWHYDGSSWQKINSSNTPNSTFMIRAKGFEVGGLKDEKEGEFFFTGSTETDGSILAGYNVFRSGEAGSLPYTIINNALLTGLIYTDTLYGNHNYGYYIESVFNNSATNLPVCSSPTEKLYVGYVVGAEEKNASIKIYPNPFSDELFIRSDKMIDHSSLYDFCGRLILENNEPSEKEMHISCSNLPTGIYLLRVFSEGNIYVRKIVKQ